MFVKLHTYCLQVGLFGLLFFSSLNVVKAQQLNEADVILQPTELLQAPQAGGGNTAYINQEGTNNEVNLIQEQMEGALLENIARVLQTGRRNLANIAQEGEGNQVVLLQDGNRNLYELVSDGTNIQVAVVQEGRRNEILQNITNSSDIQVHFEQRGNDNSIIQEIDGLSNREYMIRQIGDGMSVIIRQSGG